MAINWHVDGNDCPGTVRNPEFEFVNESAPGANDGTTLKAGHVMEFYAFFNRLVTRYQTNLSGEPEWQVPSGPNNEQYWLSMIDFVREFAGTGVGRIEAATTVAPPSGTLSCDGSAVSRSTYSDLFNVIGTTWGAGDGTTTFNLPDFRGIFLRGIGTHGTLAKANGTNVAGGTLGTVQNDMLQGFAVGITDYPFDGSIGIRGCDDNSVFDGIALPTSDGINGTPRTGSETRPFSGAVHFVIRYS